MVEKSQGVEERFLDTRVGDAVTRWAERYRMSEEELLRAVSRVGNSAAALDCYLRPAEPRGTAPLSLGISSNRSTIDLDDAQAVVGWCERLKVTRDELRQAVMVVGPVPGALEFYLRDGMPEKSGANGQLGPPRGRGAKAERQRSGSRS